ncbi:MAG TPA: inclusion body family protein [Ruminiclostridium sp.]|nr:inclusion body family protein [Ruminiclostridium sp.]
MKTTKSSSEDINVMIVIDTDYVKTNYPNPSQDPNNPTGIDHKSQFMICTDPRGIISGQGTADLNFKACPGDEVSFRGTSIYGNSDDAVIIYGIKYWSGDNVFNTFLPNLVRRKGAVVPSIPNVLPPNKVTMDFISYDSKVAMGGTENFYVYFALYTLDDNKETQNLFGYYYWDPTITVG